MAHTIILRLKSGQLIASQIWEFCYSYDYNNNNDNDNDNNGDDTVVNVIKNTFVYCWVKPC